MRLSSKKAARTFRLQMLLVLSIICFVATALTVTEKPSDVETYREKLGKKKDSIASVKAFNKVYQVLMHPRCMNCHPSGDVPLQGNDSHIHTMLPQRGEDGKGLYAMQCPNCHHSKSVPGENTPPANPNWHLPPADMKMVFEGKSAHELAKQLVNPDLNGHKSMEDLIEHANDTLVKAGWAMGGKRVPPPLTYEEWKSEWLKWIKTGAYAPAE